MSRTFTLNFTADPENLLQQAKELAARVGILFDGDNHHGTFSGQGVAGEYHIDNRKMMLTISEKPLIIPWSLIETKLKEFFV